MIEPVPETKIRGVIVGDTAASDITIREGRIVAIEPAGKGRVDAGSKRHIVGPPLFDIQVNGCGGVNLQSPDVVPEDLRRITDMLAQWGVSHWVPTLITLPQDQLERTLRVFAEALEDPVVKRAVPGFHVEGPYISPNDGPRGAHTLAYVRKPSLREFDRWQKTAKGKILYITVAPEVPGAVKFIRGVVERGVVVSLGHHAADADAIARAADSGATLVTHLGNGCAATIHRHHNHLWPQVADDRLACSLIADLEHLPEPVLKVFTRALGPDRIILTSDAVHLAGLPPGRYKLAAMDVDLLPTGRIQLTGTDLLAGSSLMLIQGVLNAARHTDLTLEQAWHAATTNPARVLGVRGIGTRPKIGKKANLLLLGAGPKDAELEYNYIAGPQVTQ